MKCGCLRMEVGLCMFGVEAPHMLCERPAHIVLRLSTNGAHTKHDTKELLSFTR